MASRSEARSEWRRSTRREAEAGGSSRDPLQGDPVGAQASELLLSFLRLGRSGRQEAILPAGLRGLVDRGVLARRHLTTFAVITLEGPMAVSTLAARTGVAVSTASLLVTQLASAGLVRRHEDSADRRRTVVSVAPAHRRESRQVLESKLIPLRRALERMGPERAAALLEGVAILAEEAERGAKRSAWDES